jgi:DNA-binding MarR family transcriptional regulator
MPVSKRDVVSVQRCYPQIYLACHTRHERRRANAAGLTPHESSLLAHLSAATPMRSATLAKHLGVGASTLSAAVKRLTSLGYIARDRDDADGRAVSLRLSAQGAKAMQAGSVLDTTRVAAMLSQLIPTDRTRAIEGLALLADAARRLPSRGLR